MVIVAHGAKLQSPLVETHGAMTAHSMVMPKSQPKIQDKRESMTPKLAKNPRSRRAQQRANGPR